jgi:hypothetical protein
MTDQIEQPKSINASRMDVIPKLGAPSNISAPNAAIRNMASADRRTRAQKRIVLPSERPLG